MNAQKVLDDISAKQAHAANKIAIIGLDGFVDKIVKPIASRHGPGEDFEPIPSIEAFGNRILDAAGKSTNIELFEDVEKLGGNGPIMADAVAASGFKTNYIGALGIPVHPVFEDFAKRTSAVSIAQPGVTHALEFADGKIMLGAMADLENVTLDRIIEVMGEGAFLDSVNRADLVALVNWTMLPNMTPLLEGLLSRILPNLGPRESGRTFYFDLTDPAKRSRRELKEVLGVIARFRSFGAVTLGLNLSEACQVAEVLGLRQIENNPDALKSGAGRIRTALNLSCVVIHPREGAACSTREGECHVDGPYCANPRISTGAGDHFNAGFAAAQVLGMAPETCLAVAVATSGQYVRTARSPSLRQTASFIESWTQGKLSE